jgi:hypothetical protein
MTPRSLSAWLLMAVIATAAMMPATANAQSVSRDHSRRADTTRRVLSGRTLNDYRGFSGQRSQAYRQPPRFSRSFSQSRTTHHQAHWTGRHDNRRW